jgi:hypothetical protein
LRAAEDDHLNARIGSYVALAMAREQGGATIAYVALTMLDEQGLDGGDSEYGVKSFAVV